MQCATLYDYVCQNAAVCRLLLEHRKFLYKTCAYIPVKSTSTKTRTSRPKHNCNLLWISIWFIKQACLECPSWSVFSQDILFPAVRGKYFVIIMYVTFKRLLPNAIHRGIIDIQLQYGWHYADWQIIEYHPLLWQNSAIISDNYWEQITMIFPK